MSTGSSQGTPWNQLKSEIRKYWKFISLECVKEPVQIGAKKACCVIEQACCVIEQACISTFCWNICQK